MSHPSLEATDVRITQLLAAWHEAGRAAFLRQTPRLDYDAYTPKRVVQRRKYLLLDEGTSSAWVVDRETEDVFHIKSRYGVPDKRKRLGTVDTVTGQQLFDCRWWYLR